LEQGPRYAIYFVPAPDSRLYRCGSSVLGYDCYRGEPVDFPDKPNGGGINWRELGSEPRRYGFHATLKAPFHLSPAQSEPQLVRAVENFARLGHAVHSFVPTMRIIAGFFAMVPRDPVPGLERLAASCTTIFDAFRAPITPRERARRLALKLNEEQIRNLDRWGYPYVLSEYRFHMTLTGKVPVSRQPAVRTALQRSFQAAAVEGAVAVDRLALVKQNAPEAFFRVIVEAALGRGP
jgi:Protein of unknown function (DUF1045)